jgi:ElaB/YqjD/DUF883 family membrane-anchored ribosome-binding protein
VTLYDITVAVHDAHAYYQVRHLVQLQQQQQQRQQQQQLQQLQQQQQQQQQLTVTSSNHYVHERQFVHITVAVLVQLLL